MAPRDAVGTSAARKPLAERGDARYARYVVCQNLERPIVAQGDQTDTYTPNAREGKQAIRRHPYRVGTIIHPQNHPFIYLIEPANGFVDAPCLARYPRHALKRSTTTVVALIVVALTFVHVLPVFGAAGSELKVGSWNIRRLSASSRDNDELKKIAQVIHPMDCVAIMELHDDVVLGKLVVQLETMGGTWRRIQTPAKVGNTSYSAEHYGFVYRSDKLKLRGLPQVLPESTLTIPNDPTPWKFDRQPYTVGFATLDNLLDFRVIVVHVTFHGMPYQRAEVRALKDYFTTVQNSRTTDDDVILCGDFNVNVGDESLNDLLS